VLEHRDIVVGDVPVCNRAHFPVAEVIAGQQVVVVKVVLRAVGGHRLSIAPVFRQIQPQVQFNQLALCGLEPVQAHVPTVDERQHVRGDIGVEMAGRLGRAEIAAHRENGQQVALGGLANLRIAP